MTIKEILQREWVRNEWTDLCTITFGPAGDGVVQLGDVSNPSHLGHILGEVSVVKVVLYRVMEQHTILHKR